MKQELDERRRFVALIRQYDPLLMRVCSLYGNNMRNPSADLYQEVVCHLWEKRSQLFAADYPTAWIFKVARRVVISQHRSWLTRNKMIDHEAQPEMASATLTVEAHNDDLDHLYGLLRQLDEDERALVALYLDGYKNDEIAQMMQLSYAAVATRLKRAKAKLKALHEEAGV